MASASFSVAISQISLGLALVTMLWRWKRGEAPPRTGVEVSAAWLALWALAMIPLSGDAAQSAVFYRRFYLFSALWVGCSLSISERYRIGILVALLVGALGISLYGEIVVAQQLGGLFVRRFMGTSNSMTSGALLMMVVLVVVAVIAVGAARWRWRLALSAGLLPVALSLMQTMTRSAILGLVCGLAAMVLLTRPRRFLFFMGVGVVLVGGVMVFGEESLPPRLWSRIKPESIISGAATEHRLEMWRGGLQMIKENPLTGVGDRDLLAIAPQYYGNKDTFYYGHLHSNQVMLGAIWGIPGLILGQLFVFVPLVLLVKRWRRKWGTAVARRGSPVLAAWVLGGVGVWTGFFVAGFTEWYLGDAEPMVLYLSIIGVALGQTVVSDPTEADSVF